MYLLSICLPILFSLSFSLSLYVSVADNRGGPDAWICGSVSIWFQGWIPTWCWLIYTITPWFDPYLVVYLVSVIKPSNLIRCYHHWFTKVKKHMELYFADFWFFLFFSFEDESEASQMVQNQFFCAGVCVNTSYLFHQRDMSFLAPCHSVRKGISWALTINNTFKL